MFNYKDILHFRKSEKYFLEVLNKEEAEYIRVDKDLYQDVANKIKVNNYLDLHDQVCQVSELKKHKCIFNANIVYKNLAIHLPILINKGEKFDVFFYDFSLSPKVSKLIKYRIINKVLSKLGIDIDFVKIIYLNGDYIQGKDSNRSDLFLVTNRIYRNSNYYLNLRKEAKKISFDIDETLDRMNYLITNPEDAVSNDNFDHDIKFLYKNNLKPFDDLPADSILHLFSYPGKYELYNKGIRSIKEIGNYKLNKHQLLQYQATLSDDKMACYKNELTDYFKRMQNHKIAFIDFEWETYAIPKFDNLKVFDVVCFQYSLHQLNLDGSIEHFEFIGYKDARLAFIKSLLKNIDQESLIVAYNANGAEKLRLKELANSFPEYKKDLMLIANKMYDISEPFVNGMFYHLNMRGSYSLKAVFNSIFPLNNYENLQVNNAMNAVSLWRELDKELTKDKAKEKAILEYCSLDSYAMLLIYKFFIKYLNLN